MNIKELLKKQREICAEVYFERFDEEVSEKTRDEILSAPEPPLSELEKVNSDTVVWVDLKFEDCPDEIPDTWIPRPFGWLKPTPLSELIPAIDWGEISKTVEYIERNANKVNEHTHKVYKEQILAHIEDLKYYINQEKEKLCTQLPSNSEQEAQVCDATEET